ncbi:AsmA-like C-terminal region-containing protein, partial [bacterium]|nr:AsmA-like C-terminal region-containing protein [bacterium]
RGLPDVTSRLAPETAAWLAETPLSLGELAAGGSVDLPWPLPPGARYHDLASGLAVEAQVRDLSIVPPRQTVPWRGSAALTLQGAAAELKDVRIDILDGNLAGHLRFGDLDRERALCSFSVDGDGVQARILLDAVAPVAVPYLEGVANLKMAGAMVLGSPAEMRASLELAGDLALRDGTVHASSWLDDISPYLGDRQDLKDIRFRHLVQRVLVRDGKLIIENLMLDGHDTDWRGGGWFGLDGGIDMSLNVKFPADFQPELGDLTPLAAVLRGDDGRIALNLDMKGRAASPRVMLDLAPAKECLSERIEDGVKGFLDKLRGNK